MRMKTTEIFLNMTWTPVMKTTNQPRKRTAPQDRPARLPVLPAPAHGLGPGKRVQVQGNYGQNVSINPSSDSLINMENKCAVC